MGGTEQKYVQEAFDTNWIAPLGPNLIEFEKAIESFVGNGVYAAGLSSGTAALHLALEVLPMVVLTILLLGGLVAAYLTWWH